MPRCTRCSGLRYEVYCLEQRFVDAARCTDGRESDDYDLHAIHFAAATERGEVVATLRLVLDSPIGFPLERHASRAPRRPAALGAAAHRGGLAPHHRATVSQRHHPRAADPLRALPPSLRGVVAAGARLSGGGDGAEGWRGSSAGSASRSCRWASRSATSARSRRTARRSRRCGRATGASSPISGAASGAAGRPSAISA